MEEIKNKDLTDYLEYLRVNRNYSYYTILNYESDIIEYFVFLNREGLDYLDINYQDLRGLLEQYQTNKYKSTSIRRKISSLKGFYKYLVRNGKININPFIYVTLPKKEKKLPKFLNINEMDELFIPVDFNDFLSIRNRLIIELLYATGIRVSELVSIKLNDISDDSIRITGKGDKERIVFFNDVCKKYLDKYLIKRNEISKSDYLIINHNGKNITTRMIRIIINDLIKKTSIMKHVSPHVIRHTFATHLLNNGCDLLTVQELLGHSSISTTGIYTHVSSEHIREVYYKTHPRSKIWVK